MSSSRRLPSLVLAGLLAFLSALASAQTGPAYTSIVVFGDSLCDTGNDALLSSTLYTVNAQVPGPATGYTNGRFTDGLDTAPAARNYQGVWVEQLAALLTAKPPVVNSLSGGTNYAYGFATTDVGSTAFTYGPGNALSFNVQNMGLQLSTYLATKPVISSKTLYVVWGGANDLIAATTSAQIIAAAQRDLGIVQSLISAGATDILVVNLPPLGLVPRFNGSATTSAPATGAAVGFDQALAAGFASLPAANPGKTLHLFALDTYTLFNTIVGPPVLKALANVTMSSQGNTTINPDTYLFWDDLHPTTFGHSLVAAAALTAIGTGVGTTSSLTSTNTAANLNASVTFTASVATTSSTPMGTVTFYDGTTALGSSLIYATSAANTAAASFTTTTLSAGNHTISASFAGVNGYVSSTSPTVAEVVTAPAFSVTAPTGATIMSGGVGTASLGLNAVGGYMGTVTFACGTLPAHFTCNVYPTSVTFPSTTTTAVIEVGTSSNTSMLTLPLFGGHNGESYIAAAFMIFPGSGLVALLFRRRRPGTSGLKTILWLALFTCAAAVGLTGCGSGTVASHVSPGSYTIPVVVTANGASSTVNLAVTVN